MGLGTCLRGYPKYQWSIRESQREKAKAYYPFKDENGDGRSLLDNKEGRH